MISLIIYVVGNLMIGNVLSILGMICSDLGRDCNPLSTGSILLADVLPAIFIKLLAPFIPISTAIKVCNLTIDLGG